MTFILWFLSLALLALMVTTSLCVVVYRYLTPKPGLGLLGQQVSQWKKARSALVIIIIINLGCIVWLAYRILFRLGYLA